MASEPNKPDKPSLERLSKPDDFDTGGPGRMLAVVPKIPYFVHNPTNFRPDDGPDTRSVNRADLSRSCGHAFSLGESLSLLVRRLRQTRQESPDEFPRDIMRNSALGSGFCSRRCRFVRKAMRDQASLEWLDTTLRDIRYALRSLRRDPGFVITTIMSLTLGLGASLAVFTVADDLLALLVD
jgi:hypothetical protein